MALAPKFRNWLRTLGAPEDPVATDTTSEWSAMSLLKAIYGQIAGGGLQAGLVASLSGTSTTSLSIGTGSKSFTTQSGKGWSVGQRLRAASDDTTKVLEGEVTAYSGTTLTLDVDYTEGASTHADWNISIVGSRGATGATGAQGPAGEVTSTGSSTANNLAKFSDTSADVIVDAGVAASTDGTFATNSDAKLPTEKAVTTYVAAAVAALRDGVSASFDTLAELATAIATKATSATTLAGYGITDARGQGKETIWIPASAMWPRVTNGPSIVSRELTTSGDVMIKGWGFDTTTEEAVQFYVRFPKSWNKGTIAFQAYWTNTAGLSTETVSWGLSAGAFTDDDAIDSTELGTEVRVSDTFLAQNDLHVTAESAAVTVGNTPIEGDLVIGQIARSVANDNMTGDAELLGIALYFTTNAATDA